MQFTLAVTALLAGVVISLSIPGLPQCAQDCVTNLGGCNKVDVKCICSNAPLLSHLSCCVSTACNATEQQRKELVLSTRHVRPIADLTLHRDYQLRRLNLRWPARYGPPNHSYVLCQWNEHQYSHWVKLCDFSSRSIYQLGRGKQRQG